MREPLSNSDLSSDADACSLWSAPPVLLEPWHPARAAAEGFIAAQLQSAFGVQAPSPYPTIAAHFDALGQVIAAAGVRSAEAAPLFLERYLDQPIEQAVAGAFARPVIRDSIVEIGSLGAADLAAALSLFGGLSAWLAQPGRRRYAVATVRPELERLLIRSGFVLRSVAKADPGRLGASAADWGDYYAAGPRVLVGEIGASRDLSRMRDRLDVRLAQRAARTKLGRA